MNERVRLSLLYCTTQTQAVCLNSTPHRSDAGLRGPHCVCEAQFQRSRLTRPSRWPLAIAMLLPCNSHAFAMQLPCRWVRAGRRGTCSGCGCGCRSARPTLRLRGAISEVQTDTAVALAARKLSQAYSFAKTQTQSRWRFVRIGGIAYPGGGDGGRGGGSGRRRRRRLREGGGSGGGGGGVVGGCMSASCAFSQLRSSASSAKFERRPSRRSARSERRRGLTAAAAKAKLFNLTDFFKSARRAFSLRSSCFMNSSSASGLPVIAARSLASTPGHTSEKNTSDMQP